MLNITVKLDLGLGYFHCYFIMFYILYYLAYFLDDL